MQQVRQPIDVLEAILLVTVMIMRAANMADARALLLMPSLIILSPITLPNVPPGQLPPSR